MQKNIRVLVVDDEPDSAASMAELLEIDGYEVSTANSGESALQAAMDSRFDCVMLDINMPGMDGAELAQKLRDMFGGDIVLVAVTGHGDDSVRAQAALTHSDHFFVKPVKLAQLRSVFRGSP